MAPTAPVLTVVSSSPTAIWEVDLQWTASAGATYYTLYRYNQPITSINLSSAQNLGDIYDIEATVLLDALGTWYFAVTATETGIGTSPPSNSPSVDLIPFEGPGPNLLYTKSPVSSNLRVSLKWNNIPETKNYVLRRHTEIITGLNVGDAKILGTFGDVYTFTDEAPSYGVYYYRLTAVGWDGTEFHSDQPRAAFFAPPGHRNWYVTKSFIGAYARLHDPDYKDEEMTDEMMDTVNTLVNTKLQYHTILPEKIDFDDTTDTRMRQMASYIRASAVFEAMDLLISLERVTWSPGLISSTTVGPTKIEMQRTMPMFFFAKGIEDGFFQLLANETPRMKSWWIIRQAANLWHQWDKNGEYTGIQYSKYQVGTGQSLYQIREDMRGVW